MAVKINRLGSLKQLTINTFSEGQKTPAGISQNIQNIQSASINKVWINAKTHTSAKKETSNHHLLFFFTFASIYWAVFIGHLRNVFTRLSLVKRAKGSGRGVTVYKVVCVCVLGSTLLLLCRQAPRLASVSHSPVEVEVPHVFGRFLRGTHLLIVEDDPPVWHRDIDAVTHTQPEKKNPPTGFIKYFVSHPEHVWESSGVVLFRKICLLK